MAGGINLAGERETRPTGLSLRIVENRGREGVHANSPRPRERPEDAAEAVVAMAGDAEVDDAHGLGTRGHETRN
jgi:hypothetical protein